MDDYNVVVEESSSETAGKEYGVGNAQFLEVEVFVEAEKTGQAIESGQLLNGRPRLTSSSHKVGTTPSPCIEVSNEWRCSTFQRERRFTEADRSSNGIDLQHSSENVLKADVGRDAW